jgi:hypothetical protein
MPRTDALGEGGEGGGLEGVLPAGRTVLHQPPKHP